MSKVYVVTSGEYSDYEIEKIFTTREAAEKYCAIDNGLYDTPRIEEYELEDGSNIQIDKVYKAVRCDRHIRSGRIIIASEILYSVFPYMLMLVPGYDNLDYETYMVPINHDVNDYEVIKKICSDSIAKYRAEQLGL